MNWDLIFLWIINYLTKLGATYLKVFTEINRLLTYWVTSVGARL